MFQDITSILAIAAASWAGWEAYRANQRLDEESKPVFKTYFSSYNDKDFRSICLNIQNNDKNSIFVNELKPINFDSIVPQSGINTNDFGEWSYTFGTPERTYQMPPQEIISGKSWDFNFKVPKNIQRIKIKIHYSIMTSSGLKKASCVYDYLISSSD